VKADRRICVCQIENFLAAAATLFEFAGKGIREEVRGEASRVSVQPATLS
jgi:hypothetical protein